MKLPSLRQLVTDGWQSFTRFPLVLTVALIGTCAASILVEYEGPPRPTMLFNVLLASILGISFLTSLVLYSEKQGLSRGRSIALQVVGLLFLVGYGWTVPTDLANAPAFHILQFFFLATVTHLMVSVMPFSTKGEVNGFWQFNKALLFRAMTTALYSFVLYLGLIGALAAVDVLFGIDVPGKRYFEMWIVIVGLFSTLFFLSGVPNDLRILEESNDYPKGLKVFAQYILLTLVLVYFVILYAYLAKIIIEWNWPQGWTSKLILGFSGVGMLSFLLLHPIAARQEQAWITKGARWFYLTLIPLIVMLFLAVWRRMSEYGLTEGRYLALALGVWLLFIVLYLLFGKSKSIKAIPASLAIVALISGVGPWSAFTLSEASQIGRLEQLLTQHAILVNGHVVQATGDVPFEDARQISSLLSYLHDFHGYGRIQRWFIKSLRADTAAAADAWQDPAAVSEIFGVPYVHSWQQTESGYVTFTASTNTPVDIAGYDKMITRSYLRSNAAQMITAKALSIRFADSLNTLTISTSEDAALPDSVRIDLRQFISQLSSRSRAIDVGNVPPEEMSITVEGKRIKARVFFSTIQVNREESVAKPTMYSLSIFIGRKE
jgi:hypothetical protein